jgi:glycosyltransferase involved in cell wall biosynthesis
MSKRIIVVVPSYNNINWYQKNLKSLQRQEYDNFHVLYVDDCSVDGTGSAVEKYIKEHNFKNISLTQNVERKGALRNLYDMIHSCNNDDIIITVDGDDWLEHSKVLQRVAEAYADPNVWLTYGQYRQFPTNDIGGAAELPHDVIQNNKFREHDWCTTHLRTFYAHLFKSIKKEDLQHEGKFFNSAWDLAMMFPMLEMAGHRSKFIPEVLYRYNVSNPISDFRINVGEQGTFEHIIRTRPKYYPIGSCG